MRNACQCSLNLITKGKRTAVAALRLAMTLLFISGAPLFAHSYLKSSQPADGATVPRPVNEVSFQFSAPIEPRYSHFRLVSPAGAKVLHVNTQKQQSSRQISFAIAGKEPGTYRLEWSILAIDGHRQRGKLSFVVR